MCRASRLLACASLLIVSACASAPSSDPVAAAVFQPKSGASAYGLYLAGHAALNAGDAEEASAYFSSAARLSGSSEVREKAFFAAVMAGDLSRAVALAPDGSDATPGAVRLARMVNVVDALARGDGRKALAALSGEPIGYPYRTAAALLKPWAAAAAGDWTTATAAPVSDIDRVTLTLSAVNQAELLERARRLPDAEAALKALVAQSDRSGVFLEAYGDFLERRGRRTEALALYDDALAKDPDDSGLRAARARIAAPGRQAPALGSLQAGSAKAMTGAAAAALLAKQAELSMAYLRMALRLDPGSEDAWMMLGDTLALASDEQGARDAYGHIGPRSAQFVEARVRTIWTYQGGGEADEAALKLARDTARAAPGNTLAQTTLADVLRANKQYAESVQVLDGLIAAQGAKADWRLYYLRALALDKAGRWGDAERDLKQGLVLRPDEAEILNYLGYSWIDRGERLDEALGMIQKAVVTEPNSGAVVDSLGWAYYRLGDYAKAVEQLERACQLEPADAEINAHLGDAYWRVGRRIEAQFQWRKVLTTMKPDDRLKAELEGKLKSGMQPPLADAKVAVR